MKTVNALELRRSLDKILDHLEHDGEPIVVCRRRTPVAALVSLKDFPERFVDGEADQRRRDAVARLKKLQFESPATGTTLDVLRALRSSRCSIRACPGRRNVGGAGGPPLRLRAVSK